MDILKERTSETSIKRKALVLTIGFYFVLFALLFMMDNSKGSITANLPFFGQSVESQMDAELSYKLRKGREAMEKKGR